MTSTLRHTEPDVRSFSITHPAGSIVPPQPAGWDQLLYTARGVMTVVTAEMHWIVPTTRAVWIPNGVRHSIHVATSAQLRNLYIATGLIDLPAIPRVVDVPPLLRELILRAVQVAPLRVDQPFAAHLVGLIAAELTVLPIAPLALPMPTDPRAIAVAQAILADPAAADGLAAIARAAGASRRTIERCFAAETAMPLAAWRTRVRLLAAMRLLADGTTVASVAERLGYSSPSAFTAMFHRETGSPPGTHRAH